MAALPLCSVCGYVDLNLGCVRLSTRVCMAAVPAVIYGEGVEETLLDLFEIRIGLVDVSNSVDVRYRRSSCMRTR